MKKVAYVDMWKETQGAIGTVETLQDVAFWESRIGSRNFILADEGIGILHSDELRTRYGLITSKAEQADLLICSQFGEKRKQVLLQNKNVKLVLVLCYEPTSQVPDPCVNAKVVYLTSQFSKINNVSADNTSSILYIPLFVLYYGFDILKPLSVPRSLHTPKTLPFSERKACLSIISNTDSSYRKGFLEKLMKIVQVDNYGKLYKNAESAIVSQSCWYDPRLMQLVGQYKCILAMENTSLPGYHSEKIMHGFRAFTVPIYWGDPLITRVFSPESFVEVLQGKEEVAFKKIHRLCTDEEYWKRHIQAQILQPYVYSKILSQKNKLEEMLAAL